MSTDPEQIRTQIAALLSELPDLDAAPDAHTAVDIVDTDIEDIALRLEEAHDLLVRALEAVERTPSAPAVAVSQGIEG